MITFFGKANVSDFATPLLVFGIAVFFLLLLLSPVVAKARRKIATSKLGEVRISVDPKRDPEGAGLDVEVAFAPKSEVFLNSVTAVVTGSEVVVSGSGTDRTSHTHIFFRKSVDLAMAESVGKNQAMSVAGRLAIPETVPPTISLSDNDILWEVTVHLDVANWPDYIEKKDLEVLADPTLYLPPSTRVADDDSPGSTIDPAGAW